MTTRRYATAYLGAAFLATASLNACYGPSFSLAWEPMDVGLTSSLRGLSAVDSETVWVSGSGGTYAFTRDGGSTWTRGIVPGADSLDFRDVEAFPTGTAFLMSAGTGAASRIYRTTDWGENWGLQHTNGEALGFFNGMAFWDEKNGAVVGDPVDGFLFLLVTRDGGVTWERLSSPQLPAVMEGEYGFAASGTNITTMGDDGLAVASGGSVARVFLSRDRGSHWTTVETPLAAGNPSSGIFSIHFKAEGASVMVGGDYQAPNATTATVATSVDGGVSWYLAPEPRGVGFRSGVAWGGGLALNFWVAVGTSGSSVSLNDGRRWSTFDSTPLNAVAFAESVGWAAGPEGKVVRLRVN